MVGNRRLIILGFDGLDPRICRDLMARGVLPNLGKLAATGTFRELNTSYPCQSPVAWRTFATGVNPGNHGVFDFLRKIPGTYLPDMSTVERGSMYVMAEDWKRLAFGGVLGAAGALATFGAARKSDLSRRAFLAGAIGVPVATGAIASLYSWLPKKIPVPINRTGGTPFWARLGEAGVKCKVLRIPVEFPAREYANCKVLSGLGVPDVRATNGTYTVFSEESSGEDESTEMGGRISAVEIIGNSARLSVLGPRNILDDGDDSLACDVELKRTGNLIELKVDGVKCAVRDGEWSKWTDFAFSASPFVSLSGKGRFYLLSANPLRLYLTPINFDPSALPKNIRVSAPGEFSRELSRENGFYKTLGWPTDTWSLNEGHVPDEVYLDDYRESMGMEKRVTLSEMAKKDWDCFTAIFTPTDQIQHVFRAGTERGDKALADAYREVDEFVGEVSDKFVDQDTTLIILSDHGFHGFDRAVNINTWLWQNGYIKFEGETLPDAPQKKMADLTGRGQFWEGVDWANTYAYSMGLGNIYLNLQGREPEGIVRPGAMAERILVKLKEGLSALTDGDKSVVRSVYLGKDLYKGKYMDLAADAVVGFHDGYRVSWQTALGGVPKEVFENNDKKWSGDHCSLDPQMTPGVLFSNRSVKDGSSGDRPMGGGAWPSVMDIAPSAMSVFGLDESAGMEGESLWT
ncbi:MAG: alkaline phosphatase family protein [Planctomycetes bacterium]|nr:alkaline phosphatase family protein [Planctomycetota bacterium]